MNLFSKNLRFLRKYRQLNQDEIAALFNKRANTIGNWENQKSEPNIAELMKLGEYFEVQLSDLLHTDLERKMMINSPDRANTVPSKSQTNIKEEPFSSLDNEGVNDSFWLILRELRSVNEKLDVLSSSLRSPADKKASDKSNH